MARIVIDARIISSSTGRYAERLLHYLEQIDTTNTYLVLVPSKDRDFWRPTNSNFSIVTIDFDHYSFAEQIEYRRFLNQLDVDLVHFLMPQQPVLYRGKHVTTFHDLSLLKTYNSDKNWFVYHAKQLVGKVVFYVVAHTSQAIISPSRYTKRELAKFAHIQDDKVYVTYEAADEPASKPVPYRLTSPEYLLYVGQQSDYKNLRRLILAHQELLLTHPKLQLVLVGSKNKATQTNEAWVAKNKYKNVLFTGFVSDGELAWLYRHTACYVFPSLMEGFGLPGLEAMRAGAPVASSNATCLPEIYDDAAHYFNPYDVGDMVTKIGQVLTKKALRDRLVKNGSERVEQFSWERMARQTLAVYKKAIRTAK
jgi:glycosyltransferase involved in cell wall biosynthesis